MNKNDLRYIKTEEIIREAFKRCVYEKGFKATHISDICIYARISRNTFYAHYLDKYDLLDTLFNELKDEFNNTFTDEMGNALFQSEYDSSILWYMNTIDKNREYYRMLLECSTEQFMEILLEIIVVNPMKKYVPDFENVLQKDLRFHLTVNYMFQGMVSFTKLWLENHDKISLEEAIVEIKKLCIGPLTLFIEYVKNKMEL